MRRLISMLNLMAACGMAGVWLLTLFHSQSTPTIIWSAACLFWVFCAVWLLRSRGLWPWLASLIFVSAATLGSGAMVLRFLTLLWRAEYGDRSVHLDPTTVGIPLFFSSLVTVGALVLLAALLSLPAWPTKNGAKN